MADRLHNRRIAITGAASGMGRDIARCFAAEGAALALIDRDADGAAALAAELGASAQACDVAERAGVGRAMAAAAQAMGGIDGLVHAAGVLETALFDDATAESWDRVIATNLTGTFNVAKAALPWLRQAEWATIVNIASVSGVMPMAGTAAYSASKAGVIMLTKAMAFDLGPAIRANCICPGVIETAMTRYISENPEHSRRAAERVALKRLGTTDDVARAALFLSTQDSGFTTGTELLVDGGFAWR